MNAAEIFAFLDGPVLLGWPLGEKATEKRWKHLTRAHMTPGYLCSLDAGNIGLAHGERSCGLCSLDGDTDTFLAGLLDANPALRETWLTRGARGCNLHFRCPGKSPKSRRWKGRGELRSNGNQTTISGLHPSGCRYTYPNGWRKPIVLDPSALRMPDGRPMCPELQEGNTSDSQTSNTVCVTLTADSTKRQYQLKPPPADGKLWLGDCYAHRRGQSNDMLFRLALKLKRHNPAMSERELAVAFASWWNVSFANVDPAYQSDWYYGKLLSGYRRAVPSDPVSAAWRKVEKHLLRIEKLAQLGEKLADAEGSFFLDCRKAGQLLGVSHKTAWKWMHALWTMTEQGQFRGNANQWKTISRSL